MEKFINIEILTDKVYLNIENGAIVRTLNMGTEEAKSTYGELEVKYVGEPRYDEQDKEESTKGTTDVILIEEF